MSGKSSLIAKLLDEPVMDDMKETTALDFRYGSSVKEEKKQKIYLYELGKFCILTTLRWWTDLIEPLACPNQCLFTCKW
jgi:hypothetical protein